MFIQEEYFKSIFNTVREAILVLDENMKVLSANRSFYTMFKVDSVSTIGSLLFDLGNGQWNIPHLRVLLEDVLPKNDTVDDYEIEHTFESIGQKTMLLNACKIREKKNDLPIILLAIEDITERNRLEDLLTESEKRYRRVFETASDSIVLLEKRDGTIIQANPATEIMLGYPEKECIGKNLQDIGVSLDTSDFAKIMQDLNKRGILNFDDVPVKTRSGHDIYADIYMVDRAKLAQCNIRDVSDRKHKEVDIQRLNRILVARSNSIKALISASDESWYLNEVCKIIVEDCGYALVWIGFAEQDEARTVRPVAHAGVDEGYLDAANITWMDSERGRGPVGTAIRTGKPSSAHDIRVNHAFAPWRKEAVKRGFSAIIGVPLLAEGKAYGSLNIYSRQKDPFSEDEVQLLTDLAADLSYGIATIRSRTAEEEIGIALRESEERFRLAIQATKDGIWEWNILTNQEFFSPRWCEIIGYSVDDPEFPHSYKSWAERIHPDDYERVQKTLTDHLEKRMKYDVDYRHRHKSGEYRWQNSTGEAIFNESGKPTKMVGCISDITERKTAEEDRKKLEVQLRQSQKMEAVGTLAGGVAHDFNNILNVILGYGNMVMDKLAAGSPSKEHMSEVLIAADRAANLTKRLLVFSRKQAAEVKPININELILGMQKMLVRIIRESIDFNLNLAGRSLIVLADAGQIEQVLMNLAANAKDAMQEGGRLTIGTELKEIDEEDVAAYGYGKPGKYALITVADTGHGINAETQKKIFEPFFTTKGIGEGTGLGLAISYGIIKQHNGYIKVYSEPGQGTVFKIYLPLGDEAASPDKKTEAAVLVKGGNETVLVAEDDASLRNLARIVLESFGYTVISAEDGDDAITKFMENRDHINLVLLDMIMPKKNGKEVSAAIRKVSPGTKILFVSGYTMDIIKTKELTEPGFDFIQKPFPPQALLIKVREVLDR